MTRPARAPRVIRRRPRLPLILDPVFEQLTLSDLRRARQVLVHEMELVDYWRRVIGVPNGSARPRSWPFPAVRGMQRAMAEAGRSPERMSLVPGGPAQPARLPDLVALYARATTPGEPSSTAHLADDLAEADQSLADHRSELQHRLDKVTTQLIIRYRDTPRLALQLLPATNATPSRFTPL